MAQNITIKGVEYLYRLDMGALLNFESLMDKVPEEIRTPRRVEMVMHYACLLHNDSFSMQFDEFVQSIDTQAALDELTAVGAAEQKRWEVKNIAAEGESDGDGKVKKK